MKTKSSAARRQDLLFWLIAMILMLLTATLLLRFGYRQYLKSTYPDRYRPLVEQYAAEHSFDPSLIFGIILTESHFRPQAQSPKKAKGLMQLTDDTFQWAQDRSPEKENLSPEALFDPETNIRYGVKVLALLAENFEDEDTLLAAYNAGIGTVTRWLADSRYSDDGVTLKEIPYPETREYVRRVRQAQQMYQSLYGYGKDGYHG